MESTKSVVNRLKNFIAPSQQPQSPSIKEPAAMAQTAEKEPDTDVTEKFLGFVEDFKDSKPCTCTDAKTNNDFTISRSDVFMLSENRRVMLSLLKDLRVADDLSTVRFYSKKLEDCLGAINFVIQKFKI